MLPFVVAATTIAVMAQPSTFIWSSNRLWLIAEIIDAGVMCQTMDHNVIDYDWRQRPETGGRRNLLWPAVRGSPEKPLGGSPEKLQTIAGKAAGKVTGDRWKSY
ncbi:hypothetical protein L484_007411 [Morus notabilis]|uniref:Uncharacterized protein n=1 Tax=Morus notabilis TaxID=981085 RepID=W9QCN3_9ROSA|nr:hypothetical protein L484_007411 [Morus notabilis]